jgi:hypothetical protein
MCVPVTTKPFFNSVIFDKLQRVSLLNFLLINKTNNQYTNSGTKDNHRRGDILMRCLQGTIPFAIQISFQSFSENIIDMTDKYYCNTSGIFESHYK